MVSIDARGQGLTQVICPKHFQALLASLAKPILCVCRLDRQDFLSCRYGGILFLHGDKNTTEKASIDAMVEDIAICLLNLPIVELNH